MSTSIHIGLAAQRTMLQRLETIAANVANESTPGYRAEEISFKALVSPNAEPRATFPVRGETHIATRAGAVTSTGNSLDVAISGDAWFQIATADGRALTRDGRFAMSAGGELQTVTGLPVLDAGGAPVVLDPAGGPPSIARDGRVLQAGRQTGAIGLFMLDPATRLSRGAAGSVVPDRDPIPQLDFDRASMAQGFIERSNVDPVKEIARLIALQRTFDAVSSTLAEAEAAQSEAIKSLGGG